MRKTILMLFALAFPALAWAAATVQTVSGDVRIESAGRQAPLGANQRVDSGATVHTGTNGRVMLRFDDGQMTALNPDTSFRVDEYRFDAAKPESGSVTVSLLKGALRMVTGLIGARSPERFAMKTPTATIGIRGTDFMAATGSLYLSISQGLVTASTSAGSLTFGAGQLGFVSAAGVMPASIAISQLPAGIASSFSQLGGLQMAGAGAGTGASGAGASGATGAAAGGGIGAGAVAAGAVAAGALVGAVSDKTSTTSTTSTGGTAP